VVMRFGQDTNKDCMKMDELLYKISDRVRNFATIYVVDNKGKSPCYHSPCLVFSLSLLSGGLERDVGTGSDGT
jgi:hypothetical protein